MTRTKTQELTGVALDWAVAKAEKLDPNISDFGIYVETPGVDSDEFFGWTRYQPSTYWSLAGPIIDRELITTSSMFFEKDGWKAWQWTYWAQAKNEAFGPTPLIAAMRCYVASKLGNEIDIPEGLLPKD